MTVTIRRLERPTAPRGRRSPADPLALMSRRPTRSGSKPSLSKCDWKNWFRGAMRSSAWRLIRISPTKSMGISLTSRPSLLSTADAETQEAIRPNWAL